MAVYKLFPEKDTTLYSAFPALNTGIDAILEVSSTTPSISPSPRVARSLIQFNQTEIEDIIDNKVGNSDFSSSLRLYASNIQGINLDTTLEIFPASDNWGNGTGEFGDLPQTTNGSSWKYISYSGSSIWKTGGYSPYTTGSYTGSISQGLQNGVGGNWYTGSSYTTRTLYSTQAFGLRSTKDLNTDVTNIIHAWYTASKSSPINSINNNGFIVKLSGSSEFSTNNAIQPVFKYYSVDTNTIYPPTLEIKWDDSLYSTTLPKIATTDLFIGLDSNPGEFRLDSINRFRLNVRPEFPVRTFKTSSLYTENFALPSASYYAIKDLDTNEFVVDFDNTFTKVSCDNNSNYFDIHMSGLEPERYYKILVKTTISGSVIVKDEDYYFKVVNG
tara:strand:+ start:2515 stop:3672 length:1158 start_codon:yes stop_codon:yes gene_type:complete